MFETSFVQRMLSMSLIEEAHEEAPVINVKPMQRSRRKSALYSTFEKKAATTFRSMYPTLNDPMAILDSYCIQNKLRLVDLFFQIDKDRSGKISVDELVGSIEELGLPINGIQAEELVFRMDLDGDGEVDYQEFVEAREGIQEEVCAAPLAGAELIFVCQFFPQ
eukprot:m.199036 g.199036  ORF g.199036 m.199036 type:complete len:164 (-) comp13693_c1_seq3:1971-2462(-)